MLCAVYIVCKVLRPTNEIKFVDILAAYRTQPQFNREVNFLVENSTLFGDLTSFGEFSTFHVSPKSVYSRSIIYNLIYWIFKRYTELSY